MLLDHATNDAAFFAANPARLLRIRHPLPDDSAPWGTSHVMVALQSGGQIPTRMFFAATGAEAAAMDAVCEHTADENMWRELQYQALKRAWGFQ